LTGITSLRIGQYNQQMVPIKEMTDVLRVVKERIGLRPRQWVRLKRGIYKDDLAQVDYVDMAQNQVHLKVKIFCRVLFLNKLSFTNGTCKKVSTTIVLDFYVYQTQLYVLINNNHKIVYFVFALA
jgi:hypothetical protein